MGRGSPGSEHLHNSRPSRIGPMFDSIENRPEAVCIRAFVQIDIRQSDCGNWRRGYRCEAHRAPPRFFFVRHFDLGGRAAWRTGNIWRTYPGRRERREREQGGDPLPFWFKQLVAAPALRLYNYSLELGSWGLGATEATAPYASKKVAAAGPTSRAKQELSATSATARCATTGQRNCCPARPQGKGARHSRTSWATHPWPSCAWSSPTATGGNCSAIARGARAHGLTQGGCARSSTIGTNT